MNPPKKTWTRRFRGLSDRIPGDELAVVDLHELLAGARKELKKQIKQADDATMGEVRVLANAESRLLSLRREPHKSLGDSGLDETEAICHALDARAAVHGRRKGIETTNLERKQAALLKRDICVEFFRRKQAEKGVVSRQQVFNLLKRDWEKLRKHPDLECPKFSAFKDYCKGL